ncbi:hypothetical protein E1264_24495 [Actinomadura sp. KC216]|uniref:hypothetical protein n=1 Tax=Actinomadura sp. KC216 TaxID=2530370 RepID=UPI00104B78C9|nr:hypothetical protein [Actinomadura sp. KC216]TDB84476.1 hypothetical protein E1264_24495 [Actinomadura sp. KC216]
MKRWEHGVIPEVSAQQAICEMLGLDPAIPGRVTWPVWLPTGKVAGLSESWDLRGTVKALSDVSEGALVDRRAFLGAVGAELLLPVMTWRLNPGPWLAYREGGRRVSPAMLDDLERLIAVRRKMDDEHGGGALLGMLHSDLRFVADLIRNGSYHAEIGQRLHMVAAELARLAGWSAFDSGRHAAAQQYYLSALRAAASVGDTALGVNIVGFMGIQAYSTGNNRDAAQLMDVATAEAVKTPAIIQAMAWARAGRAQAKIGDTNETQRALNKAEHLFGRAVHGDTPPWAYWVDEARIMAQRGRALYDLGDYNGAESELMSAITSCGEQYPRDRATWLGRVAISKLRTDRMDEGCSSGREAVDLLADQVDSDRGLDFLRTFKRELAPHEDSATAREFMEYASERLGDAVSA